MLGTASPDPSVWNTEMMDFCGDWDNNDDISLSDILEILYFMLGSKAVLYPNNPIVHNQTLM
jgi:hypothetical protein